jgi:hypothetical protein
MPVNWEFVSNEINESELQYEKHDQQIIWTWRGTVIDLRDEESWNIFDSMRVNSESVSNEIDESDLQYEKHSHQKIWIWLGIRNDSREETINAFHSMGINPEFISDDIMKEMCNLKGIVNKEFDCNEKLWLIWEKTSKCCPFDACQFAIRLKRN